jgi:hypothetical protein
MKIYVNTLWSLLELHYITQWTSAGLFKIAKIIFLSRLLYIEIIIKYAKLKDSVHLYEYRCYNVEDFHYYV